MGGLGLQEVLSEGLLGFIGLSLDVSRTEEFREKCKTKVSEHMRFGSKGQVLGSGW